MNSKVCLCVSFLIALSHFSSSQDGMYDETFGGRYYHWTENEEFEDEVMVSALQEDGKIVIFGRRMHFETFEKDFLVQRYTPQGVLDETFGEMGTVTISTSEFGEYPNSMVLQDDGKIIIAGHTAILETSGFIRVVVIRLLPNGELDTSFNETGIRYLDYGFLMEDQMCGSIALTSAGKIVVGGNVENDGTYDLSFFTSMAVLNPDGSLDSDFSDDGMNLFFPESGIFNVNNVLVQSDGKYVLVGTIGQTYGVEGEICAARFLSDGSLDTAYGVNGYRIAFNSDHETKKTAASILYDNSVIVCGSYKQDPWTSNRNVTMYKFLENGSFDEDFGDSGNIEIWDDNFSDYVTSLGVLYMGESEKYIIGGYTLDDSGSPDLYSHFVASVTSDGNSDWTFFGGGEMRFDFGENKSECASILCTPDSKFYCVGKIEDANMIEDTYEWDVIISKFNSSGSNCYEMGMTGLSGVPNYEIFSSGTTSGLDVGSGNVYAIYPTDHGIKVARFNASTGQYTGLVNATSLAIDELDVLYDSNYSEESCGLRKPDGKFVTFTYNQPGPAITAKARVICTGYTSSGNIDGTFGYGGYSFIDITPDASEQSALYGPGIAREYADGRLLFACNIQDPGPNGKYIVVTRFLANGLPDNDFGDQGKILIDWSDFLNTSSTDMDDDEILDILPLPDGGFYMCGLAANTINGGMDDAGFIAKYTNSGILDTGFNFNGYRSLHNISPNDENYPTANRMGLDTFGRVFLLYDSGNPENDNLVVSFLADGSFNSNFSEDGILHIDDFFGITTFFGIPIYSDMLIQPDNKILLFGSANLLDISPRMYLKRLLPNGDADDTFMDDELYWITYDVGAGSQKLALDPTGNIFISGTTGIDFIVGKLHNTVTIDINEKETDFKNLLVYPNPISSKSLLTVRVPEIGDYSIHLVDMQGRIVKAFENLKNVSAPNSAIELNISEIESGAYVLKISSAKNTFSSTLVVTNEF